MTELLPLNRLRKPYHPQRGDRKEEPEERVEKEQRKGREEREGKKGKGREGTPHEEAMGSIDERIRSHAGYRQRKQTHP